MNFSITRQPLALAFLTLVVLAVVAVVSIDATAASSSVEGLGDYITLFQTSFPVIAKLIAIIMIVATGMTIGRMSMRYNLFGVHTYISIPLYGAIVCGGDGNSNFLLQFFIALLFLLSIKNYISGFKTSYGFSDLFRGSLYLGTIPLLYPQSAPILLLMPVVIFVFKRTGREFVVALAGEVLPFLTLSYVTWCCGGDFLEPIKYIGTALSSFADIDFIGDVHIFSLVYFSAIIILVITSIILFLSNIYSINTKPRSILIFSILSVPIIASTAIFSGSSTHTIALMATPISMIIPVFFLRAHSLVTTSCYVVMLAFCILNLYLY